MVTHEKRLSLNKMIATEPSRVELAVKHHLVFLTSVPINFMVSTTPNHVTTAASVVQIVTDDWFTFDATKRPCAIVLMDSGTDAHMLPS